MFIKPNNILVESLESFKYIYPVIYKQGYFDFFLSCSYPFYFFFLPIALSKISSTVLNKSGETRYLCLIPDFIELPSVFPIQCNAGYWLVFLYTFIILSYPPIPSFFRALTMKDVDFFKGFVC
jgi:hypothetical protein